MYHPVDLINTLLFQGGILEVVPSVARMHTSRTGVVSGGSRPLDDLLQHTPVFILTPRCMSPLILHPHLCSHVSVFTHLLCTLTYFSTLGGMICKEKNL